VGAAVTLVIGALFLGLEHPWALQGEAKLALFPLMAAAFREWMAGHLPLWSNGLWAGYPLISDPLAGSFYLPHFLYFGLTPAPHFRAWDAGVALHAGLLAAGTVRLLGQLGVSRLASLFGTALVLLTPQMMFWSNYFPGFVAAAWWPWMMLSVERLARPSTGWRRTLRSVVLTSLCFAAQVFAGYPELAVYSACVAGLWILTTRSGVSVRQRIGRLAAVGLASFLLAAPQIIPTALELADTGRASPPAHGVLLAASLSSPADLFDPRRAASLEPWVVPSASTFVGLATTALAIVAVVRRRPRSLLLLLLALGALAVAVGDATPLHDLVYSIPPFSSLRGPCKFLVITQFCLIWLAAGGLQSLLDLEGRRRRGSLAALALALCAVLEYGIQFSLQVANHSQHSAPREIALPRGAERIEGILDLLTARESPAGPPQRVFVAAGPWALGSLPAAYGVEILRGGILPFTTKRQREILMPGLPFHAWRLDWMTRDHLDLFGVQLVLRMRGCETPPWRGLEVVANPGRGVCVLRNPHRPQRYALFEDARPVADDEEMTALVRDQPLGPIPILASPAEIVRSPSFAGFQDDVKVLSYRPGAVRLKVGESDGARGRFLLARESWRRGWRATVDGKRVPVYPAAGVFFAVPVPPGPHEVALTYTQAGLGLGLGCAALWLLGAVAAVWLHDGRDDGGRVRSG
jgi:hypothetical protein